MREQYEKAVVKALSVFCSDVSKTPPEVVSVLCTDKSFAERTELKTKLKSNELFVHIGKSYLEFKAILYATRDKNSTPRDITFFKERVINGSNLNDCYIHLFGSQQVVVTWHTDPEYEKSCLNQKQQINFVLALIGFFADNHPECDAMVNLAIQNHVEREPSIF